MKDKEKQILAIAQDLSDCLEYDIEDSSVVDTYDTAYKLANKGWVKLLEDSVVISREEYEDLQVGKDFDYGYHEGYKNTEAYYENFALPQTRKETAEKIFNSMFDGEIGSKYACKVMSVEKYNELAKQFGVEIKE